MSDRCNGYARRKGDMISIISEPFGQQEIGGTANASGIIIGRTNLPLVSEGEGLFHITRFESTRQAENTVEAFQADELPIHPDLDEEPPIVYPDIIHKIDKALS